PLIMSRYDSPSHIKPLPPSPTLFPYTTLFRSVSISACGGRMKLRSTRRVSKAEKLVTTPFDKALLGMITFFLSKVASCVYMMFIDRKSTRLNSSHVKISYAVFCLKKKKIKYID